MSVHYYRPGHAEIAEDSVSDAPQPMHPAFREAHELIEMGLAAGATDEDLKAGLAAAKATVVSILEDRLAATNGTTPV